MEPLSVLKDSDIFESPHKEPTFYRARKTAKGIVYDKDKNIALLSVNNHSLFPGGGVEAGETFEEALVRECKEEIGCDVLIVQYIGRFDQLRAVTAKNYEVHFFLALVIGEKGLPTTKNKGELACELTWETHEDTLFILENQLENMSHDDYTLEFNCRTHLEAFKHYLGMKL